MRRLSEGLRTRFARWLMPAVRALLRADLDRLDAQSALTAELALLRKESFAPLFGRERAEAPSSDLAESVPPLALVIARGMAQLIVEGRLVAGTEVFHDQAAVSGAVNSLAAHLLRAAEPGEGV